MQMFTSQALTLLERLLKKQAKALQAQATQFTKEASAMPKMSKGMQKHKIPSVSQEAVLFGGVVQDVNITPETLNNFEIQVNDSRTETPTSKGSSEYHMTETDVVAIRGTNGASANTLEIWTKAGTTAKKVYTKSIKSNDYFEDMILLPDGTSIIEVRWTAGLTITVDEIGYAFVQQDDTGPK